LWYPCWSWCWKPCASIRLGGHSISIIDQAVSSFNLSRDPPSTFASWLVRVVRYAKQGLFDSFRAQVSLLPRVLYKQSLNRASLASWALTGSRNWIVKARLIRSRCQNVPLT
jgi:hypothetical protein